MVNQTRRSMTGGITMQRMLLAAAAVLFSAGAASAADMPVKAPPPPPVYQWTGFYTGIDGGWGWGTSSGALTNSAGTLGSAYSFSINGPIFGTFGGYQRQFGMFVGGIEYDWQFGANIQGNSGAFPISGILYNVSTTAHSYGSVRGRLGLAFDRFLVYGTGGWARGTFSTRYAFAATPNVPFSANNNATSDGWTAGGGIDYLYTDNVFLFLEYRYTTLNAVTFLDVPNNAADTGNKIKINDVRAGVGVKY
jgi:outer membrane immunogenic protein